jgi:hypothetical protein
MPDLIPVPRLIGLTQAAAEAALTNAGLALGTVTRKAVPQLRPVT